MTALLSTLRTLIRAELARTRAPALGTVTQVYPRTGDSAKDNHQVDVKPIDSGRRIAAGSTRPCSNFRTVIALRSSYA